MADAALIDRLRGLEAHLRARIRGQDHVLARLANGFARAALGLPSPERPGYSCLLVGPTGTGKSESFSTAAHYVFGREGLLTFDLSEYQHATAINKLLGESRDDAGLLGRELDAFPSGAILFDEIEKAHPLVMDVFLQILWRGCVTVATGRKFHTGLYVIGFSSNIGGTESMRMRHLRFASVEEATLRRVTQSLRAELLGRIHDTLVFARLEPNVQREICGLEVERELARLRRRGFNVAVSHDDTEALLREGFLSEFGARPLRIGVEKRLQDRILSQLLPVSRPGAER